MFPVFVDYSKGVTKGIIILYITNATAEENLNIINSSRLAYMQTILWLQEIVYIQGIIKFCERRSLQAPIELWFFQQYLAHKNLKYRMHFFRQILKLWIPFASLVRFIDILYTLDSASNYSAIQKLKPWLQTQDIPMKWEDSYVFYFLNRELKGHWHPKFLLLISIRYTCGIFNFIFWPVCCV
jgi:hypothetical protein